MNDIPFSSATSKWHPDKRYRFQLAFCRNLMTPPSLKDLTSQSEEAVSVPPFKLPANEPDINNIVLSIFLNHGFLPKVKAQSKDQRFYLKLFKFPEDIISPKISSEKILSKFFLTAMQQGRDLQCYTAQAQNVFVKYGWIELDSNDFASRPFPKFLIPKNDAQEHFDSFLPFSSLYVSPPEEDAQSGLSEEQIIEHSRKGVSAFQQELFKIYRSSSNLVEVETDDPSRMFAKQDDDSLSVIWLKQIEFFKDIRKRPMPLNRDHDFLSSLLLVHYTDFIPDKKGVPKVPSNKEDLDRDWIPNLDSHHILEIASVVQL
jgi:hypothetical protein